MTAIAYRSGILAADTVSFCEGLKYGTSPKIRQRDDGAMAGAAGRHDLCEFFLDAFMADTLDNFHPTVSDDDGFVGMIVDADGTVWEFTDLGKYRAPKTPFHAIGSAHVFLIGAMAAGASSQEAVRLAIIYCADVGGKVQTLEGKHR
jgi:hypothetical protein